MDRLPPHSDNAEKSVLSCVLLDGQLAAELKLEWFYDIRHKAIAETALCMASEQALVNGSTVGERLIADGTLEQVGGFPYFNEVGNSVTAPTVFGHFREILEEHATRRRIIATCAANTAKAYDVSSSLPEVVDGFEREALSLRTVGATGEVSIKELVRSSLDEMEACAVNKGRLRGIATGFQDFDRMTQGLRPGQLIVIAARPSVGKTSLAMNIAENVSVTDRIAVGVFSLEMTAAELTFRTICSRARVSSMEAIQGELNAEETRRVVGASAMIAGSPLHICDAGGLTIAQITARARRMTQKHRPQLFVVDYLQLIRPGRRENRQVEVAECSAGLKMLAKDLGVPIIACCQLNRDVEKDGRKPRLSDLRDSGAIEQDADIVGLLHRVNDGENQEIELIVDKHRNGPTGLCRLIFQRSTTRFQTAARQGGS